MSVRAASISAMPGDLERAPGLVSVTTPSVGPAMLAAELLGRVRAELPVINGLGEREQILVPAWLTGLRSARTRRAYAVDVVAWLGWLANRDTGVLAARRLHVDLWAATQLDDGAAASIVRRRLSALSSFYRYCAAHDLVGRVPTQACPDRWWIRTTPPRSAWTGTRPGPWSPLLMPTPAPRRCAPRRLCGCCCTTPRAWMRPAPPTSPTWRGLRPPGPARGPQGRTEGEDPAHPGHRGRPGCLPGRSGDPG